MSASCVLNTLSSAICEFGAITAEQSKCGAQDGIVIFCNREKNVTFTKIKV